MIVVSNPPPEVIDLVRDLNRLVQEIDVSHPDRLTIETLQTVIVTASGLRRYAEHYGMVNEVAELQLRAERKAGQWLLNHVG